MYYTYILRSEKSSRLYTGYTSDLRKRFNQHSVGKSSWTKDKGPWKLIYYEACLNIEDAAHREKYLKTGVGKRFVKSRLKRFLSPT